MNSPIANNTVTAIGIIRDVFILGDRHTAKDITQALAPLNFLQQKQLVELSEPREGIHFIIAICNLRDLSNMQIVARSLTKIDTIDAHKIIYATEPAVLDQQHLFFAIELGARFTVSGANRDFQLKEYIKRISLAAQSNQGASSLESEIAVCSAARDDRGLQKIADKLSHLPKDHEEVLRLQAITSRHLRLLNKSVYYLRRLLTVNPQNLWAASELGRMYLRSNRVAEGIEVLEKLSQFHDLNSERVLELGNAYLDVGRLKKAERAYTTGSKMIGSETDDDRFQEGLAKVKTVEGDIQSALSILGRPTLSEGVLGFINMRAILAIRNGQVEDGIRIYQMALEGCREDKMVRAKLHFNIGLAYAKIKNDEAAIASFQKSVELGGTEFNRAKAPLEISIRSLARRQKNGAGDSKPGVANEGNPSDSLDTLNEIELDDI